MDTDVLRFFQQVADGATVTEVAELYQVSQPGVSRGLQRLEEEVGTPLLMRSGRLLRPTHAGSVFKRHVDAVLHALDDGLAAAEELIDPESGTVRLAFQRSLGTGNYGGRVDEVTMFDCISYKIKSVSSSESAWLTPSLHASQDYPRATQHP